MRTVRIIRETTKNTTPAGNMTLLPFGELVPTPTLEREKGINVQGHRQPLDYPATMAGGTWTARSDGVHGVYQLLWESLFGSARAAGPTAFSGSVTFTASGNTMAATGIGSGLVAGDFVLVTAAVLNGAKFVARLTAAAANLLTVDADWKTLVNEGPIAVTVSYAGRYRLGSSILTNSIELYDGSRGDVLTGAAVTSATLSFTHPNKWEISWQGVAMKVTPITAQLGNGTTTPTVPDIWRSGIPFGLQANPTWGFGFRYGGDLLPDLHVKGLSITIPNPLEPYGAAGADTPYDVDETDGQIREITVDLNICRDNSDAEDIIADAGDANTLTSLSFGQGDGSGNITLLHFAGLRPVPGQRDGLKQGGKAMASVKYQAIYDATHTALQITEF